MDQVRVALQATDALTQAGLAGFLQSSPGLRVLGSEDRAHAQVLVVAADRLSVDVVALLRRCIVEVGAPVVLVTSEITEAELLTAVGARVVAILPRHAVTAERLVHSVRAAASGAGVLPPNLVGELLKHVERMQRDVLAPHGLNAGLTPREIDVLRLVADGLDTAEIAGELCYSERTVKHVIYGVTRRLKLRNRAHAVAYALRTGMI